jgi:glyoxylase-like metal-dependent hydrolase (beta-lactamase superfamily II)
MAEHEGQRDGDRDGDSDSDSDSHVDSNSGWDWEQLAPGVVRRRLPRWDATVGAVRGSSGVLVIDTGSSLAEGARIRAELYGLFGLPVTQVALTHAHFDHVLGSGAFGPVQVYGAAGLDAYLAGAREELSRDAVAEGMAPAAAAESTRLVAGPRHLVRTELTLRIGERQVLLVNLGPAHSQYDLAVLVPGTDGEAAVVFCGDLVEESGEPQAGPDADPASWPAALDGLLSLGGEDALYVPGHGAVVDAAFVRAQRDVLARRLA